jgi:putative heme uptake system protein
MQSMASTLRRTFILVDGENIDATLGNSVLGHKPEPGERPRWDRVVDFARQLWGQEVTGLFFLNATNGYLPGPFISALQVAGYRPIPLAGSGSEKVVDIGIQRTLDALLHRSADVLLCTHDRDFLEQVERLVTADQRVGIVGFPELVSGAYSALDVELYDLEADVHAFTVTLPRVRIIPLDEFDPTVFLR